MNSNTLDGIGPSIGETSGASAQPGFAEDGRSLSGRIADFTAVENASLGLLHPEPISCVDDAEAKLASLLGATCQATKAKATARCLLLHYGSVAGVLAASAESLGTLLGEHSKLILFLRDVREALVLALREAVSERPVFSGSAELRNYLHLSLAHESREIVRLLFLDAKNGLILDELHSRGTVSHAPVYPREIVRRLIEINATALIIVHNHPTGDPTPSAADVEMTRRIGAVLSGIDVALHDSVIVGRFGFTSLRNRGLL